MTDRARKPVFYLLALLLVWAVVELAAVVGHAVLDGGLFSPGRVRDQAGTVTGSSTAAMVGAVGPEDEEDRFSGRWIEVIHPYFGVVVDPDRDPAGTVSDLGFVSGVPAATLLQPHPDTRVIGIFGGSFAAGIYRQSARAAAEIEQRLAAGGRKAITVNFAKGGYKQPQQQMVLAYLLALGARFDVVVNVDGFNEVAVPPVENVARGVNPFYPRQWHLKARDVLDPDTVRKVGYLEHLEAVRSRRAEWLLAYGLHRSAVTSLIWRTADRRLAANIADARQAVDSADAGRTRFRLVRRSWGCLTTAGVPQQIVSLLKPLQGRSFDGRDALHQAVVRRLGVGRAAEYRQPIEECTAKVSAAYAALGPKHAAADDQELFTDLARMWQRSSLHMKALCDAHGVRYYHFLQPNQYLEGSKPLTAQERRIAFNEGQPYRRGVIHAYPLLRQLGRELIERGVAFTDLTMIFEGDAEVRYADDCCHLNKDGYALVLDQIIETIAADG